MANLTIGEVRVVEKGQMMTIVNADSLVEGSVCRQDDSGYGTGANATDAAENEYVGIVTDVQPGYVEVAGPGSLLYLETGSDANSLASLAAGATVFLSDTDKTLADAAGTVSTVFGFVEIAPDFGGGTKCLRVVGRVA